MTLVFEYYERESHACMINSFIFHEEQAELVHRSRIAVSTGSTANTAHYLLWGKKRG